MAGVMILSMGMLSQEVGILLFSSSSPMGWFGGSFLPPSPFLSGCFLVFSCKFLGKAQGE